MKLLNLKRPCMKAWCNLMRVQLWIMQLWPPTKNRSWMLLRYYNGHQVKRRLGNLLQIIVTNYLVIKEMFVLKMKCMLTISLSHNIRIPFTRILFSVLLVETDLVILMDFIFTMMDHKKILTRRNITAHHHTLFGHRHLIILRRLWIFINPL